MRSADVVVIGAGLAGLAAAGVVAAEDLDVVVLEAADDVGGRVRSDAVAGLLLDRGFQLFNPAYPAVPRMFDVAALDLCPFEAGVVVAHAGGRDRILDPLRGVRGLTALPDALRVAASGRTGSLGEKAAFAR